MKLPMMPLDKANHVIYGVGLALIAQAIAQALYAKGFTGLRPKDAGLLAAVLFGLGKEFADYVLNRIAIARGQKPPHGVDPLDAVATISGGAAIWIAQP